MSELSERLAKLEGAQEHVATKADLAEVKATLHADIAHIDGQLDTLIWAIPLSVAVVTLLIQYFGPMRKPTA